MQINERTYLKCERRPGKKIEERFDHLSPAALPKERGTSSSNYAKKKKKRKAESRCRDKQKKIKKSLSNKGLERSVRVKGKGRST